MLLKSPGVAFVTGAGSGIGAAVAKAFAKSSCSQITLTDINKKSLSGTRDAILDINPKAQVASRDGDISDETFVGSLADDVSKKFNRLDYAVNCACILGESLRSTETPVLSFDLINKVNYRGTCLPPEPPCLRCCGGIHSLSIQS